MERKTSRRRAIAQLALAPLLALLSFEAAVGSSPPAVSETAPDLTDTIFDPAVDPTPSVSDTISGATDTVSDVASGATDTDTGTTGTVSGAASDATGSDATSGAGAVSREGSTRMVVGASGGAGGGTAASEGRDGGRCHPQTSTCIGGTSDDGAFAQALERILGFLAQTGLSLAGWIAVAGGLGLLGTLILLRTRRRASNGPSRPVV